MRSFNGVIYYGLYTRNLVRYICKDYKDWTFWGSGNYPFFLKKDFEGIIPAGTPMYQMIPVKRDSWQGESMPFDEIEATRMEYNIKRFFYGGYKKLHWVKKDYS